MDVVEGYVGRGEPTQPFPGVHTIQELLYLIDVVFCHARMVDDIVGVFRKRVALTLELLKLDGGDELEGLAESGGAGAA